MSRPFADIILQDYTLDLRLLNFNSRAVTKAVITVDAAAAIGATSVALTAANSTTIKAGTSISFVAATANAAERQQVLFTANATITSTPASFTVAPLSKAITEDSVADFVVGTLPLFGIQTMDFQSQETQVDTTNFQSGSGTEMSIVRNGRTLNISGIVKAGDLAYTDIIQKVSLNSAFINREIYAIATFPDGEKFEGAAKVMGLNMPANQNEVKKYSFNLTFLGDSFIWTPGYATKASIEAFTGYSTSSSVVDTSGLTNINNSFTRPASASKPAGASAYIYIFLPTSYPAYTSFKSGGFEVPMVSSQVTLTRLDGPVTYNLYRTLNATAGALTINLE